MNKRLVPLWLKVGYTIWLVSWTALYSQYAESRQQFLWMCHIGVFVMGAGLWLESPLLMSWQAVSLLLADTLWTLDFACALTIHVHPIGATLYMFKPEMPQIQRAIALYHVAIPVILIWALWRMGYDRRAFWAQLLTCWIVFPLAYFFGTRQDNINWVYGPFGNPQDTIPPLAYLFVAMTIYPIVVYLPSHLAFRLLVRRPRQATSAKSLATIESPSVDAASDQLRI
jgi:hypothetical protein